LHCRKEDEEENQQNEALGNLSPQLDNLHLGDDNDIKEGNVRMVMIWQDVNGISLSQIWKLHWERGSWDWLGHWGSIYI
jgi:hypothetical protein